MHTKYIAGLVVLVLVVGGGAFYGGMQYAAHQSTATSAAATAAAGGARGGAGRRAGGFGAGAGAGALGGGMLNGSIVSNDGQSLTLQSGAGGSKVVFYATSTRIAKTVDATQADLAEGANVSVVGTTNSDGSVTASMIQLRQPGSGLFGGSASGTATTSAAVGGTGRAAGSTQ